jgi:hypothetical protein
MFGVISDPYEERMSKTSCVFLCGDRSPYGMAHLEPIAAHFDLKAIVIADNARWQRFSEQLSGGEAPAIPKRSLLGWREDLLGFLWSSTGKTDIVVGCDPRQLRSSKLTTPIRATPGA